MNTHKVEVGCHFCLHGGHASYYQVKLRNDFTASLQTESVMHSDEPFRWICLETKTNLVLYVYKSKGFLNLRRGISFLNITVYDVSKIK